MKACTTSTSTEATPTDGGGGKVSRSLTIDDFNGLTLQLSDPLENFELLILQKNKRLSCIIQHRRFPFNQNVEFELSATPVANGICSGIFISVPSPFATVSKFSDVKVKWKAPQTFLLSKYVWIDWSKKLSCDRKQLMKAAKTSARGRVINNET